MANWLKCSCGAVATGLFEKRSVARDHLNSVWFKSVSFSLTLSVCQFFYRSVCLPIYLSVRVSFFVFDFLAFCSCLKHVSLFLLHSLLACWLACLLECLNASFHSGPDQPKIQNEVLGHSLVRSLVRSNRSLVRLLRTARFARALRCAHSFACSLTSLTPSLVGP